MEKNDNVVDYSFEEIFIERVLNDIKKYVKRKISLDETKNKQTLNLPVNKRENNADEKMKEILRHLLVSTKNEENPIKFKYNFLMFLNGDGDVAKEKFVATMVLYYTALFYDSLDLLHEFFKRNIISCDKIVALPLYSLDKKGFANFFEKEKYFKFVLENDRLLTNLHHSIEDLSRTEKKKYCDKFSKIVRKRNDISNDERLCKAFSKEVMDIFDDEDYLNATVDQYKYLFTIPKELLENEEILKKVKWLINNTKFAVNYESNFEVMLEAFTPEELEEYKISAYDSYLFHNAKRFGSDLSRVKNIYLKNKNIVDYGFFLFPNILQIYDDDTLASFDSDAIYKITIHMDDGLLMGKLTPEKEEQIRNAINEVLSRNTDEKKKTLALPFRKKLKRLVYIEKKDN